VFELLERANVALCLHDMAGSRTDKVAIGPFVYVRFHGPARYAGRYDDRVLDDWADWLAARMNDGRAVFAYFNNDSGGHAPEDAARLRRAITRTYNAPTAAHTGAAVSISRAPGRPG
jgi:uncharacterized protein YecE (DUF72 family)